MESHDIALAMLFVDAVRVGPERLTLYEGLPHQFYERDLLSHERSTKAVVEFGAFPFYEKTLKPTTGDVAQLVTILSERSTYLPFSGEKMCGGFHPDYAVVCQCPDQVRKCLICFGCSEVRLLATEGQARNDLIMPAVIKLYELLRSYRTSRPPPSHEPIPQAAIDYFRSRGDA